MPPDIMLFVAALAAAYAVPGPDMLLVLETSLRRDRTATAAVIGGLALARSAHVTLAGAGLTAMLETVPEALAVVRLVGAAWLIWLGWRIFVSAREVPPEAVGGALPSTAFLPFRRAFLTNLLNPKALLFCSVLLPQFAGPADAVSTKTFAVLGGILVLVGILFDIGYAAAGASLGQRASRHSGLARFQQRTAGALLIALAVHLAATS